MRLKIYLDETILLLLASKGKHKQELIVLIEGLLKQGYQLCSSVYAQQRLLEHFATNEGGAAFRNYWVFLEPLLSELLVVSSGEFHSALDIMELHSISLPTAIHAAVMRENDLGSILSYNSEFEKVKGLEILSAG